MVLKHTLSRVRWFTITTLLMLSIAQPISGRFGQPTWVLILAFAAYNWVATTLLRRRLLWLSQPTLMAATDLLALSLLYSLGASSSGPLSVLFMLITVCASATISFPRSLTFTGAAIVMMGAISPTLPHWSPSDGDVRNLVARLIVVALAGSMTGLLVQELECEQRLAQTNAADAARQAELNRLRGTFVSSISHDLRTPLTAMTAGLGMLELSLGKRLRDDEIELLAAARRNGERLSLLIDDLLTHNQLEAGALRLARVPTDLYALLEDAVATLRPLLDEKQQRVILSRCQSGLPPHSLVADPQRLEQALVNVLVNAHRHTPPGTRIHVSCRAAPREVILIVSDDGPGIPEAALERIFEPFQRLDSTSRGSGLGLMIAKSIVELHNGHIWAENESSPGSTGDGSGSGARICLALPYDNSPSQTANWGPVSAGEAEPEVVASANRGPTCH